MASPQMIRCAPSRQMSPGAQRLADYFGVKVAYLVGEDVDARDADADLQRMFRQASDLDPRDRESLDALLQSALERKKQAR